MPARWMILLGLVVGALVWASVMESSREPEKPPPKLAGASGIDTPTTRVTGKDRAARSDEASVFEPAQERERVLRPSEESEEPRSALADSLRSKSDLSGPFDVGALEASGFSPDDVDWFRERWEQAEMEKSHLADLEGRGEDAPPGGGYADIERELREDLRDDGYDAMLYATHQDNRVALVGVRKGSVASRAGIGEGSVVWSYDGQRVFRPTELATLSTTGRRGDVVEIVIVTRRGTQQLFVERNPLGAELVSAKAQPHPD